MNSGIHHKLRALEREYTATWERYRELASEIQTTHLVESTSKQFGALRNAIDCLTEEIDSYTAVTLTTEGGSRSALVREVIADCAVDRATTAWDEDPNDCDEPMQEDFDALEIALRGKPTPLDKELFMAAWGGYVNCAKAERSK